MIELMNNVSKPDTPFGESYDVTADRIVATAHYHDQPPIDTPADVWSDTRTFPADTPISEIYQWAIGEVGGGKMPLNRLEITIDSATKVWKKRT